MSQLIINLIIITTVFLIIIFVLRIIKYLIKKKKQKIINEKIIIFQNNIDKANSNNKRAMYFLSNNYLNGEETEVNYIAAFYWAYKAESLGYKKATKLRKLIENKITVEQKAAAILKIENELIKS